MHLRNELKDKNTSKDKNTLKDKNILSIIRWIQDSIAIFNEQTVRQIHISI